MQVHQVSRTVEMFLANGEWFLEARREREKSVGSNTVLVSNHGGNGVETRMCTDYGCVELEA